VSEIDLIRQARQGDESAWVMLVEQHRQAVFRLAYLLLGNADEAQDVAQEVFIQAFRKLNRFDSTRPLRPWLLRITTNLVRNRQRSLSRYLSALQRWFQTEPDAVAPNPGEEHLQQQQATALWQAVRQLGPSDREIIYLRYFLELSTAETAQAANIAPGTVKSRLHRALARLQQVITEEFPALIEEPIG
jgi:RNA polymerase sigma-70 factor (ECF subfamily)